MEDNINLTKSPGKKQKKSVLRRASQAPKRFRSSFIIYCADMKLQIQADLGGKASGPDISKKASAMWRNLSAEDRRHWEDEAMKERKQYAIEKATYNGPWKVPRRRVKKDPTAPKRNPSAFLLFAQEKRKEVKKLNPGMKITDISSQLGKLWRGMPIENKRPYVERELKERDQYKSDMVEWKRKQEETQKYIPVFRLISLVNNDASENSCPVVSREEKGGAVTHDRDGDALRVWSYSSVDTNFCQYSCDTNPYTPQNMGYHHMYPQYSPEEQSISINTQNAYAPENNQCAQQFYSNSRVQQHNNCHVNFTDIPNTDKQLKHIPSARLRNGRPENSSLHRNINGIIQLNNAQEASIVRNQKPYQRAMKTNTGKDMFDVFLDAFDDTTTECIKNRKVMDNVEEDSRKLNQYQYQRQFMDGEFPRRISSEWLDGTKQQNYLPQYNGGHTSKSNTANNNDYEPLPLDE